MTQTPTPDGGQRSLGEIVGDITQDLTTLVRQELDLAKTEMKQEAGRAGKGAGLLGGAGVAGSNLLLFLSAAAMFGLDAVLPLWLAALVVALVWGVVAGVLALTGKKALQQSNPQLPTTQRTLKEDASWARAQKS
ncbi:phage holin family protein [Nocardioides sp. Leaf374]|uniref:phage holin family protein n=1 Tax=Nocardioides sp. Leaf374 TaxID=2876560 RepID=UPI001E53A985|nr:phage holin family protein [Nocardioides sp. Leaf374]